MRWEDIRKIVDLLAKENYVDKRINVNHRDVKCSTNYTRDIIHAIHIHISIIVGLGESVCSDVPSVNAQNRFHPEWMKRMLNVRS